MDTPPPAERADCTPSPLLGPAEIRELSAALGLRPAKTLGQNFVVDPNTVRRIVRTARIRPEDVVLEVGPGLGSLTLALVDAAARVLAVEVEPLLAAALPRTLARWRPGRAAAAEVIAADATAAIAEVRAAQPTMLVSNLPYNVAVPIVLTAFEHYPSLRRGLVMVQAEVADRMVAAPGGRVYGVPTVKLAWYARARFAGPVPAAVFWPRPRVESSLVAMERVAAPASIAGRQAVFAVVDAAFRQRRKTLRAALAPWAGSAGAAETILRRAGVDPALRGERLGLEQFVAIADASEPPLAAR
ncbi:MAG: 16S rRNA (adenine(1518)-N(6)/adenine(1519)-N(6))-dimethyltransferase [Micrococcales bacterium]|nr:MAG: 16S rRNA (adenine(1518)-N(6)/adenine(1519)-N(6))-dimethyltransferase [Micrococcales bacterium]PIE27172.1 MAG: 16S rRNA (adenine(1518)-N(6)/adenine(1519)-N(6))-dimethyltransferase [Micrococcales bacterium]